MTTAQEEAAKLRKEAEAKLAEADRLARLQAEFPDLRKQVGRWDKVAYCSKSVNSKVTHYEARHNCGCCNDSPLEIWPYLETANGRIYSDPPEFKLGERDPMYGGDIPYPGWRDKLRAAGIPEAIVDKLKHHFREERERAIEAAETIYGSDDDE